MKPPLKSLSSSRPAITHCSASAAAMSESRLSGSTGVAVATPTIIVLASVGVSEPSASRSARGLSAAYSARNTDQSFSSSRPLPLRSPPLRRSTTPTVRPPASIAVAAMSPIAVRSDAAMIVYPSAGSISALRSAI